MKLIIDIPEVFYESLKETDVFISGQRSGKTLMSVIYNAVAKGTPLDDVKAEIADLPSDMFEVYKLKSRVLYMLDTIGNTESEGKE